jgi:hypothetical protein
MRFVHRLERNIPYPTRIWCSRPDDFILLFGFTRPASAENMVFQPGWLYFALFARFLGPIGCFVEATALKDHSYMPVYTLHRPHSARNWVWEYFMGIFTDTLSHFDFRTVFKSVYIDRHSGILYQTAVLRQIR